MCSSKTNGVVDPELKLVPPTVAIYSFEIRAKATRQPSKRRSPCTPIIRNCIVPDPVSAPCFPTASPPRDKGQSPDQGEFAGPHR